MSTGGHEKICHGEQRSQREKVIQSTGQRKGHREGGQGKKKLAEGCERRFFDVKGLDG